MEIDRSGCNYCGEDFKVGAAVRDHARGAIHESCYQHHFADLTKAAEHPLNSAKVRADRRRQARDLHTHYGAPYTFLSR